MELLTSPIRKHILVCVNEREGSNCKKVGGEELFFALKQWVKENGFSDIWVTRTRCLGFCNDIGTTVVIYPDQKWFLQVTKNDMEKIKKEIRTKSPED